MKSITMDRVRRLDGECGEEIRQILRHVRLSTFFHEDNADKFRAVAEMFGIDPAELSTYAWFQAYLKELSESWDDLPLMAEVARNYGVGEEFLAEFEVYAQELAEFYGRERTGDHLQDLQQDAGLMG